MNRLERFRFLLAYRHRGSIPDGAIAAGVPLEEARRVLELDKALEAARRRVARRWFLRLPAGLGYLND